jgi:hypothetical protein
VIDFLELIVSLFYATIIEDRIRRWWWGFRDGWAGLMIAPGEEEVKG